MQRGKIRIKVCGITRLEDALYAVEAGVDALGFIFHRPSPRYIEPENARLIIDRLPPFMNTVGVFVDKKRSEVEEIIDYCGLDYAQLHGGESPKYCERLLRAAAPCHLIKAFRVGPETTAEEFVPYAPFVKAFLLDTYDRSLVGGTGRSFDWSIIAALGLARPFILAGGLNPDNVADAVRAAGPSFLDVSSGVEESPGIKDHRLISEFVRAVRQAENPVD
ncbi:MAG: phosphoribosylanthranilate isomerase [Desulfobulbaceae bacterium]|jgi:phosphoribosylanthranilate isomerase|nr:phosphoribosylanthranilate isomerase [Desulfobulbaceae bacterium]MDY0351258.1 phosphoribosylanthranilate isomerase [Desulfobulbaceae bacterium]